MINTSNAYKEAIKKNRKFKYKAEIVFSDNTVLTLTDPKKLMQNGITIKDSVSSDNSFDIGAVIINELVLKLNNSTDEFSNYEFEDAMVTIWIGLELSDGTIEYLKKGVYTVDESKTSGIIITLNCLDNVSKFDRPYSESTLQYPATLLEIVQEACEKCDVSLASGTFPNASYEVQERPSGDAITFREVVSWAAQIAASWAKADTSGRLAFSWYDTDAISHDIVKISSQEIFLSDITITGIKVVGDTDGDSAYLFGNEGYVLLVEKNKLIQEGRAEEVATYVGARVVGLQFRPIKISCLSDPSMEAGDRFEMTDRKGNAYQSFMTSTTFQIGAFQKVQCNAKTPTEKQSQRYSVDTKLLEEAKEKTKEQISQYDLSVQTLTNLMTQSFGVFKTEEKQEDGSIVYYMHDKPILNESQKIWKMSADAFAVSTDGGNTWSAGMDAEGNALVNVLSAIGINFDWARGGTLTLGGVDNKNGVLIILDANGNQIGSISKDGAQISIGTIDSIDKELEDVQTQIEALSDKVTIEIEESIKNLEDDTENLKKASYVFNTEDFSVSKSGSEMSTHISEDGMRVKKNGSNVLVANNQGVEATNLYAKTYLIIGKNSRFEDYGADRTGCFWIGN